ncbi:endonuclease/exonuclease/phosphatase family protein [Aeoliella straminimaris]|nr:endonuclease/exonuclease/phosphatase family protein [Aeoliella straminimaris]
MALLLFSGAASLSLAAQPKKPKDTIRVATYNVSFYRDKEGQLLEDLKAGDARARKIAEVLRRVQPDILLLNEIDYSDAKGQDAPHRRFYCKYAATDDETLPYLRTHFMRTWPVNTGVPSGMDLDRDGQSDGLADAFGYGRYPGQYGMAVYSRFPIKSDEARTFQKFLWKDMPGAKLPVDPETGKPYYSDEVMNIFRLSSKSHWDVPVEVTLGGEKRTIHFLCSHPTPPVFDGPEDRNGRRNHDEIRLWADYVSPDRSDYLVDDGGKRGGLADGASFVILGDLNADPTDGDSAGENIRQLLEHPRVNAAFTPASEGGVASSQRNSELNANQQGDPQFDTADFSGDGHGNLRVDYVLPSRDLQVVDSGVFWPKQGEPGAEAIKATDHRLVWVDLTLPTSEGEARETEAE